MMLNCQLKNFLKVRPIEYLNTIRIHVLLLYLANGSLPNIVTWTFALIIVQRWAQMILPLLKGSLYQTVLPPNSCQCNISQTPALFSAALFKGMQLVVVL
jgi:hypothetical protein